MMNFGKKFLAVAVFAAFTAISAQAQTLKANDDYASTGPFQTIKINVVANDVFICNFSDSWRIISAPIGKGNINKDGENLVFTPSATCSNETVEIEYGLTCDGVEDTAKVHIFVASFNNPTNILDPNTKCYEIVPKNTPFGVSLKYKSDIKTSFQDEYIDGFTMPLVGDLNGDGKPEIVAMGIQSGTSYQVTGRYIRIIDGQTGAMKIQKDIAPEMGSAFTMGFPHRAPSALAIVDLDNDGTGEIIACNAAYGNVVAFKPVFKGTQITDLKKIWESGSSLASGAAANGSPNNRGYKAPFGTSYTSGIGNLCYPHPYIADLNGDGKPEIIVYNKIYSNEGKLIMSWGGTKGIKATGTGVPAVIPGASEWKNSNYTSLTGYLNNSSYSNMNTQANATAIKAAAMTGRRPNNSIFQQDRDLPVPVIVDIDGDGQQEIITGNRIYKFRFNSMDDHTKNYYCMIEGPEKVTLPIATGIETFYLSDGFTRVADIDGDGSLDIIVTSFANNGGAYPLVMIYVWDYNDPKNVKAALTYFAWGLEGSCSIPFIGDINGKNDGWDGFAYTKKLPEISILSGSVFTTRTFKNTNVASNFHRATGIKFHPLSDENIRAGANNTTDANNSAAGWNNDNTTSSARKFNKIINNSNVNGHMIALTYDASATDVSERLKLSWAMEVIDRSQATGVTLFDFNNDGAADLCYRGESDLRVISPKKSGRDYVTLNENEKTPNTSVMFKTPVLSYTGYEAPVIADVNLDGSANIIVTASPQAGQARAWVETYQFSGEKWAPAPPVWNQAMFDPTQIREDLKINARPINMLKKYADGAGETLFPYNGSWIQTPTVLDNADYIPVRRLPDVNITAMTLTVSGNEAKVKITIRNIGSASVSKGTPISFYDGGSAGATIGGGASLIKTGVSSNEIPLDIFPGEIVSIDYTLTGYYNNKVIWARVMDDGVSFPAVGYEDCDRTNNTFSASDCPYLSYTIVSDSILCAKTDGTVDPLVMTATPVNAVQHARTYQWYRNQKMLPGANDSVYATTQDGVYTCYVTEGICRAFSSSRKLAKRLIKATNDTIGVVLSQRHKILVTSNDYIPSSCRRPNIIITERPSNGTVSTSVDTIYYTPAAGFCGVDSLVYSLTSDSLTTAKAYIVVSQPDARNYIACPTVAVTMGFAAIQDVSYSWYSVPTGGSPVSGGSNVNALTAVKDNTPVQTWWVAPVYKGKALQRIQVDLELSDDCGNANPSGCAVNGTILFKEDFGGNNVGDPAAKPQNPDGSYGIPQVRGYNYASDLLGQNVYNISKQNPVPHSTWYAMSDHTYPNDPNRGYLIAFDASNQPGQFYEHQINNLCAGTKLYFSTWLASLCKNNLPDKSNLIFRLEKTSGELLAIYYTGDLQDGLGQWRMYSFSFTTPSDASSLVLKIVNNGKSSASGNDFAMDDIEIRICTPPVSIISPATVQDTLVCAQNALALEGFYADDGMFTSGGQELVTRWYKNSRVDSLNYESAWKPVAGTEQRTNGASINNAYTIASVDASHAGWYRLVAADDARIDQYNCRAMSKIIRVDVNVTPDFYPALDKTVVSLTGDSIAVTICVLNQGDNFVAPPLHVALYKDAIAPGNKLAVDSAYIHINSSDSGYITVSIPDVKPYLPFVNIVARINDDGTAFPRYAECNDINNELSVVNPAVNRMMEKTASLNGAQDNGAYSNPVSVLYGEEVEYEITAVNVNLSTGDIVITDTLPAYMNYVPNSANPPAVHSSITEQGSTTTRDVLTWTFNNRPSMAAQTVGFRATPESGVCASQPLFVGSAWVNIDNGLNIITNNVYHQGAGVSVVTFSSGLGGGLFNVAPQAVDYSASAREGVLAVPDEGYQFAGWSHDGYVSLRGAAVAPQAGIMRYDTLTLYGDVELKANFVPEEYPIRYYLNGGVNAKNNPYTYTVKSGDIILRAPLKEGDTFVGWTGSNGDEPQLNVVISEGSSGEREYYANYLHSGRENNSGILEAESDDRIWATKGVLHVRASKTGSVVRIYTADGAMIRQQTIDQSGESTIKLPSGVYIVTIDNGAGRRTRIS